MVCYNRLKRKKEDAGGGGPKQPELPGENDMKQKTLSSLLKIIIIGVALCAALVYCWIVPEVMGRPLAEAGDGEFSYLFAPWLIVISITALPIAAALVLSWIIAANIGRDRSFCLQNAKLLFAIALLALADTVYFFGGVIFLMLRYKVGHPSVLLFTLLICFVGLAVTVAAAGLSHLVRKAAALQEQSDLTI